ncbi:MAG: hypothetical protein A2W91_07715 [Bacteroidetes bacterium GWF2_38_335]|nr:MAG: hypothetical protein A2W91_07715 [Bacteroidetes bacterium GWF2_38_335]OFY79059.1 MAG: hypothetical protein A2281_03005 [Bacteroidetes bacterium RIFOXYA12_FULL_38_20]HBS86141.1 hypothetical protein [Bacteroidales bacterium]
MKNAVLITITLTAFLYSKSQNIITWCYANDNTFYGMTYNNSFLAGSLLTDSISESDYYFVNYDGEPVLCAYVRSDSTGKVFAEFPEMGSAPPEIMLYDFSLQTGDTIHYYYGGFPPDNIIYFHHYKVVISTDSVLVNCQKRKTLLLESFGGMYYESPLHFWVEGYGSLTSRGFLNPLETDIILDGSSFFFNCLTENDTLLFGTDPCFCNLSDNIVKPEFQIPKVSFYNSNIRTEYDWKYTVKVFDVAGRLKYNEKCEGNQTININKFGKGLFLINIQTEKQSANYKFLIE